MTHAIDELPQTGVVAEQTVPIVASALVNAAIGHELTENDQWSQQDNGPLESEKTEEKVVTLVKKVNAKSTTVYFDIYPAFALQRFIFFYL